MPIRQVRTGFPSDNLPEGIMEHDPKATTACQMDCAHRLAVGEQQAQEAYLSQHPEIRAMLQLFIGKMVGSAQRKDILKSAADFFTRPVEDLDKDVRERLGLPPQVPPSYTNPLRPPFKFRDYDLEHDLGELTEKHNPPPPWVVIPDELSTPDTVSSSFMSFNTSDTTVPTPEPIPTPDPTLEEILYDWVSNTVDKAIYLHVDEGMLKYDTAYVELMKAVEEAMEVPVLGVREDLADLFYNAYNYFEITIIEKERIAAEIAWEKRMRKKLKRLLRRQNNFRGYETPPSPKSTISSHESYLKPPQKPCVCHPQFHYNRYDKDRFGIYRPREVTFPTCNVTASPVISTENLLDDEDQADDDKNTKTPDTKSVKSTTSKKTTFAK